MHNTLPHTFLALLTVCWNCWLPFTSLPQTAQCNASDLQWIFTVQYYRSCITQSAARTRIRFYNTLSITLCTKCSRSSSQGLHHLVMICHTPRTYPNLGWHLDCYYRQHRLTSETIVTTNVRLVGQPYTVSILYLLGTKAALNRHSTGQLLQRS